jgi:hypothetical protein
MAAPFALTLALDNPRGDERLKWQFRIRTGHLLMV